MTYKPFCDCGASPTERNGRCASCNRLERKAAAVKPSDNNSPIESRSVRGKEIDKRYFSRLRTWKRGKKCEGHFVHDCTGEITCHHMAGRGEDFYDEWAAENNVPRTLDERLWKPLCINAHRYIEEHPHFAWENQYSFKRLTDKIFLK